jgi:2-phospho-L-lactate guanylyltransferase
VDLIVPVKSLARAKTRLRGAADDGVGDPSAHARLTLAIARDTVAAALAAERVRRVLVVSSDPEVLSVLAADGAGVLPEPTDGGLNAALEHAARTLRGSSDAPPAPLGALQADLPALRAAELDEALEHTARLFDSRHAERVFCADAAGEGTTLLVSAPHVELRPRFGGRSAAAHAAGGALPLDGDWPGLRRDVDTAHDLWAAAALGLGPASSTALRAVPRPGNVARS